MATSTRSFDEIFLARLEDLLAERYPALELQTPTPGFRFGAPRPDFVIANSRTGSLLICELKSGFQARHIPLSTLPYIRGLRDWFADRGIEGDVVLITTGEIPQLVKKGLARDGIPFFEVASPEEATERLDAQLSKLQQAA
ncbi:MAG TPA: hypothetical protein VFR81_01580 [Longimicrobium sp.]|nr:hypothetical protein [Longimicrobium sp.]